MEAVLRSIRRWSGAHFKYWAGVFRRLGVSLHAGVDILRVIETESRHGGHAHRRALEAVHQRIRAGDALWQAMQSVPGYFPPMAVEMIRVGEETGRVDAVLLRMADHYDHLYAVRREFLSAITWPVTELIIAVCVIGILIWLIGVLGITDILGFGLAGTSGLMIYLALLSAVVVALMLLIHSFWQGWWGTLPIRIAMRVPVIGQAMETAALNRFTWALGAALETGMDVRAAMRLALRSTHNPVYKSLEETCDRRLAAGEDFATILRDTKAFPKELVDMTEAAEIAGTLSESLAHMSRQYQEQSRVAAQWIARLLAGLVWLIVAAIIISLIFRLARVYLGAIYENLPQ